MSTRMRRAALAEAIARGAAPVVLDVRSGWEYARGHVPGARHVPFWTVPVRISRFGTFRKAPVVVYCGHGPRAHIAGLLLRLAGFRDVRYLEGHWSKWRREGRPRAG